MMAQAERTGAYAGLDAGGYGGKSLPYADDHFAGFVCVGSFGPGHAPPSTLKHLARVTRPGGYGVFNLIEASHEEQGFPAVMEALKAEGSWEIVHVTPPFLPFLLDEPELWVASPCCADAVSRAVFRWGRCPRRPSGDSPGIFWARRCIGRLKMHRACLGHGVQLDGRAVQRESAGKTALASHIQTGE